MKEKLLLKYVTNFNGGIFSYSCNYNLSNIIDLKALHDLFSKRKYITNCVIIEHQINEEKKILYRLINGEIKDNHILYLENYIEYNQYDIIVESVLDINDLVQNIVNYSNINDLNKSNEAIDNVIEDYKEYKKIKKIVFF